MEEVTSGEVEERGGLCAESVCDDQVPAVGQQTEVGGESDSNGEGDDVVSSLTGFSNPESCTGRSGSETSPEQISGGASQRTTKHDSNIRPDSVQQEEAVTTSSESCSSVVPHEACSGTGSSEALKLERVCNLVNYDSSDSDDSSIKTPTIENLEEEDGQVFQYPDSNSKTMEYGEQTDTGEVSAGSGVRASNEQTIGTAEQTEGGYQDGGYWNENGCWVDSQGQVWQPPEGYWQQDWTQGTEGEEGTWQDYGVDHGRGCDSQTQSQKAQAGQENEWVTQGEANLKQPDGVEEVAAHQPQGHFSNQEQSAGHCSTSTNSERLHYDQSAYQDGSSRQQSAHSGANTQSSNDAQNSNPQDCGSNDDTTYVQRHNYTSSDPNVTPSYDPRVQQHAHAYPAQHTYGHQDHYYQQGGENQQQRQQQYTGPVQYNQQEQYHSYSQEYHDQHQSYTQNSTGWSSYQYPGQQSHGSGWNDENSSWYQQQPAGAASHGHDTQSYNRHHGFEQGYHTPSDYERPLSLQFAPGGPPHGQPPPAPYGIPHPPPSHPPPHAHHYSPHSAPPPSHLPVPTPPPPHLSTPPPPPPPPQHHLSTPPHPPHLPTPPPYSSLSDPPLPPLLPPRPPPQSISHSSYSPSPQTHGVDEHYSRSTPPWPSRQHHSNHSNNSRRKWKYYRRESSHSRSSHYSSGVPSSPANSVSSDVSSTSRDSPVPVQHSPVAGSPDDSESHRPVSKTVFSNQLRDPRRCSPPVSVREKSPSMKGTRYNSSPSNLTNKKSSSRKESSGSSPSSTRSTKETEQKKVEKPDVKDSKQTNTKKQSAKEPASFPKSSLTGFRIPKHSEKGKSQSDNPSTPARLTAPTTKVNNKEEKPKTNADISQAKSGVGTTSGSAAETVGSQPLAAPEEAKVDSEAKEPAKESITTPQVSTENSLPPGLTPQQDLVSLFKSIDSTTLSALASTIQLALNSNSGKKMKLSTSSEEKVPSPLTTTKVETVECKDELKQPTLPANPEVEVFSATSSVPTASITPQDVKTDVSQEAEYSSADTHKVLKEVKSDTDTPESGSAKEAVRGEHDMLPDAMPAQSLKGKSKALVIGPPRRVIATVLSTNVAPPHLENPKKSTELTVCIPIHKEVTLHVKSTKDSPKETEEKMSDRDVANKEAGENISDRDVANKEAGEKMSDRDVAKMSDRDVANKEKMSDRDVANKEVEKRMSDRDVAKTKDTHKPSEEETNEAEIIPSDIISPTLSLLKAQDLMFDPKFMYKEYNLRRLRKQEVSPEQCKPQKKKKFDKTSPASKQKGTEKGEELDSDTEADMSPRLDRVKRGRVEGDKELSCEPPEPKKPREDAEEVVAEATRGENEKQTNPKDDEQTSVRLLDFQVSIPRHGSPPLPLTLTQLLSMPKNDEQNQNSKFAEYSPTKEVEKCNKRKNVVRTGSSVAKGAPSVGGGVLEHRLSGRPQLICSLCKLKGGVSNLGFLFGPYFYHPDTESSADSSTTSSSRSNVEVWLHEDCAVWAAGICLVGRELKGLKEALADASKMVCTACKRPGATLFCASRGCKNIYHFPCANEKGCVLMEDNFQTHCPKHKDIRVQIDT